MPRLFLPLVLLLSASTVGQNNVDTIIQRSVAANNRDWEAAAEFDCLEQDQVKGGSETYQDMMILGSPYERLVAVNEKPLTSAGEADQKRKLDDVISERKKESAQKRTERIAKYEAERKRDHSLIGELVKAFDFKLLGEQRLNGYDVYVLQAKPRPSYQPPDMETRVLTGMQGQLWIDKNTFQWVKVEAQVTRPVSIAGFLARVEPGTRFELDKTPVSADVWLPRHFSMRSRAKILFLFHRHGQEDDTYFDYHKAQPSSADVSTSAH
jgi:hypothetical protein